MKNTRTNLQIKGLIKVLKTLPI